MCVYKTYYITLMCACKVYFTYKTYNSDDVLSQIGEDQALS